VTIGAIGIEYPQPPEKTPPSEWPQGYPRGIRIGIVASAKDDDAWDIAQKRFPANRRGQLARNMATKISDSSWHKQMTSDDSSLDRSHPYSLWPFQNGYTSCPYLIGSYDIVATEIARYLRLGYSSFILDIPQDYNDIQSAAVVFHQALVG
jgi:alkanesulfonate monooxygenase